MMNQGLRIGNRNMAITAPVMGSGELRSDLDDFKASVVLESPSFNSPHVALMERGAAWYTDADLTPQEAARRAQMLSGQRLGGVALQTLAYHAEEIFRQSRGDSPDV